MTRLATPHHPPSTPPARRRLLALATLAVAACALPSAPAHAQAWPAKPVTLQQAIDGEPKLQQLRVVQWTPLRIARQVGASEHDRLQLRLLGWRQPRRSARRFTIDGFVLRQGESPPWTLVRAEGNDLRLMDGEKHQEYGVGTSYAIQSGPLKATTIRGTYVTHRASAQQADGNIKEFRLVTTIPFNIL